MGKYDIIKMDFVTDILYSDTKNSKRGSQMFDNDFETAINFYFFLKESEYVFS